MGQATWESLVTFLRVLVGQGAKILIEMGSGEAKNVDQQVQTITTALVVKGRRDMGPWLEG